MIVKAIYEPNFGDKTTGDSYETQIKRHPGDVFECDNKLAKERIKKGFVVEATDEEKEVYKKQQEEIIKEKEKNDNNKKLQDKNDDDATIKALEDCTIDELIEIAKNENIGLEYPKDDTAKDVIVELINKARNEKLNQPVVE